MAETPDLAEIHDFLVDLASKAGEMITSAHPLINGVGSKKNSKKTLSLSSACILGSSANRQTRLRSGD